MKYICDIGMENMNLYENRKELNESQVNLDNFN